jgi:glucosamine--fructose-6-phosphate aminotransferase (isomerizing)
LKHGPIALVDENLPVLFIATKDAYYEKIVSNIQEIKARKGKAIAVLSADDSLIFSMADQVM